MYGIHYTVLLTLTQGEEQDPPPLGCGPRTMPPGPRVCLKMASVAAANQLGAGFGLKITSVAEAELNRL